MSNIVDLFSDIEIKKNDINGFDGDCDVDKKEVLDKIRNKVSQRKVDSKKEDIEKLKNKFMYKKKIKDPAVLLPLVKSLDPKEYPISFKKIRKALTDRLIDL